jgi:hypothetical protein
MRKAGLATYRIIGAIPFAGRKRIHPVFHSSRWLSHFAGHDEKRLHFEALVVRPKAIYVVLIFDVQHFFRGGNGIDRQVVVAAIPEYDQPPVDLAQEQIQGQVAISHRDDRIEGVGIAAADQVA